MSWSQRSDRRPIVHVKWVEPGPEWNPFTAGLVRGLESAGADVERSAKTFRSRVDVVVLQFPEQALARTRAWSAAARAVRLLSGVLATRALGVDVVWIVHNVRPHDHPHPRLTGQLFRALSRVCGQVFLSGEARRAAAQEACLSPHRSRVAVAKHPLYSEAELAAVGAAAADAGAGAQPAGPLRLVHAGRLRAYKGSDRLLQMATEDPCPLAGGAELTIIGPAPRGRAEHYERWAEAVRNPSVRCHVRSLTDEELVEHLVASDAYVLLADDSLHNSGSALLALSVGTSVVLSDGPASRELAEDFPNRVATVPSDCRTLGAVVDAASSVRAAVRDRPAAGDRRWELLGGAVLEVSVGRDG